MKVKSKIFPIDPILSSNWRERDQSENEEERLAKRFTKSLHAVSGSKRERIFTYNKLGFLIPVDDNCEK